MSEANVRRIIRAMINEDYAMLSGPPGHTIAHIIEQVKLLDFNRVVVASCTPLTHEPLFQDAIRHAGLNPHMFEMANIRNQCSWVHSDSWESATSKAKLLARMAVARATQLEPLKVAEVPVNNAALVIGGGAAGMTAALALATRASRCT